MCSLPLAFSSPVCLSPTAEALCCSALLWCHWLVVVKYLRKWEPHWSSAECCTFLVHPDLRRFCFICFYIVYEPVIDSFWRCCCVLCFDRGLRLWVSSLLRTSETPCLLSGGATCLHRGGDTTSTPLTMVRVSELQQTRTHLAPQRETLFIQVLWLLVSVLIKKLS